MRCRYPANLISATSDLGSAGRVDYCQPTVAVSNEQTTGGGMDLCIAGSFPGVTILGDEQATSAAILSRPMPGAATEGRVKGLQRIRGRAR